MAKGGRRAFDQRRPIAVIITDMDLYVVVCFKLTAAIRGDIGSPLMVAATDKAADKVWVTSHASCDRDEIRSRGDAR